MRGREVSRAGGAQAGRWRPVRRLEARWPTKLEGSDSSGPDGAGKVAGGQAQGARGQAARWPEERARCPAK